MNCLAWIYSYFSSPSTEGIQTTRGEDSLTQPHLTPVSQCSCWSKSVGGAEVVTTSLVQWIFCNFLVLTFFSKHKGSVQRGRLFFPFGDVCQSKQDKLLNKVHLHLNAADFHQGAHQEEQTCRSTDLWEFWRLEKAQIPMFLRWRALKMSSTFSWFTLVSTSTNCFAVAWYLWGWLICDLRVQRKTRTMWEPILSGQEKE